MISSAAAAAVFLTLAIDPGDGTFRYSDDGQSANHSAGTPTARAGEWRTLSYQAMLNATGTARFALFNWQKGPGLRGAETVQMSGLVIVAAVGARFNPAGGEQ